MYVAWLIVGSLWAVTIVAVLSIGIFILPLAIAATWFLARRPESRRGMAALIAVAGMPFFLLARLDRSGQGTTLRGVGGNVTGFVHTNPWPWVTLGVSLFGTSVLIFIVTTHQRT
jgi:hypothetical protein